MRQASLRRAKRWPPEPNDKAGGDTRRMDLELAKKMLQGGIKFVANSGLQVVELRRGYVKCLMPYAGNGNHIGTITD